MNDELVNELLSASTIAGCVISVDECQRYGALMKRAAEALTPQTSEEVVEAVARAIYDATHAVIRNCYAWDDAWEPHQEATRGRYYKEARAAIAAMPSIPQESDAEVTEEMLSAGRKYLLGFGIDDMDDSEIAGIYTAMTSARDREQPK